MIVDVQHLVIGRDRWSVAATVRNDTHVTLLVGRPHHAGGTEFGLLLLANRSSSAVRAAGPGVFASTFVPGLPALLRPGARWSGTFSGRGRLPRARYARIELGRFTTVGPAQHGVPWRFRYITDHASRLP
jgi:hypothetical protein